MAGNNYNLSGGYVQKGKVYTGQVKGDIAFVYSKLKRNDEIFGGTVGYTTQNRSWRRVVVKKPFPQEFPGGDDEGYCCIECPDNCGDYETKQKCLDGDTDKIRNPGSDSSLDAGEITVFLIYLLHYQGGATWWGSYSESVLVPTYLSSGDQSSQWNHTDYPHSSWSYQVIQPVAHQAASTALIVPPDRLSTAKGRIGWCGTLPSWKGEVWQRHQDSVLYAGYGKYLHYTGDDGSTSLDNTLLYHYGSYEGQWDEKFGSGAFDYKNDSPLNHYEDFYTTGDGVYFTAGESNWCSSGIYRQAVTRANEYVIEDPWCLEDPTRYYKGAKYLEPHLNVPPGVLGSPHGPTGYETAVGSSVKRVGHGDMMTVVWEGSSADVGSVNSLISSITNYWGFEQSILCGGHTWLQGCFKGSDIGGNPSNIQKPNPPAITWGEIKGRKSEVFLNFQDLMGNVKELKLPVEFSNRPTHIRFDNPEFYPSGDSGWLPRQPWYAVEWFDSRISMTKDDIFVDILYEMVQEWEPVNGAIKLLTTSEPIEKDATPIAPVLNGYYNICGNYDWTQFLIGGGTKPFEGYSRPKKTRFNKIKSFKINKVSFAITGTADYTYPTPPSLSQGTIHNNLIKHYTLLDTKTYLEYWDYYEKAFADGLSSETYLEYGEIKIPYLPDSVEYLGLPLTYPQLMERAEQFARANDFIKPQASWTQLDWIFWELLERPNKTDGISYIEFLKNGKFGYHGRTQQVTTATFPKTIKTDSPYAYYVRQPVVSGNGRSLNIPDYYLRVLESERLRSGGKLDETGKIIKWWRISPISFPVIMTGGAKTVNTGVS